MTDELEDGGALAAAFGEMADPSKLGDLPTEVCMLLLANVTASCWTVWARAQPLRMIG